MQKIEYSKIVLRKLEKLKNKLAEEYGKAFSKSSINQTLDTLENSIFASSNPGISIKNRFGIDTTYRFIIVSPNIFILNIIKDKVIIKQMFHEKEDYISKFFKITKHS